ncbi:long-chain fatty acid transport protein [Halospina denitrificans]|uniref:Long-chain fatty acid transport protein n=1 Tax=Halospina denitrificans TaxID=332522 RepID=A0A4R7K120_9GAMM|nr:outer membrane protein transport protein [Halospina denitrificans]TDT43139.1 long-chain fatty acid transport protein [Halospina denitrificans]
MATTHKKLISVAIAAAVIPVSVQGAGFGLNSHSAKSGGTSHAGTAVMAEDPATVFYNPAGMVLNDKAAVSGSFAQIMPEFDFTDENSSVTIGGTPLPGDESMSDEGGLAPSFYYMAPFRDDWAVGISINAPYGSNTKYDSDWIGRFNGIESDIRGININPNIAHEINDSVSIGFGINIQKFDATLIQQRVVGQDPNTGALITDETEVEGDSWSVGYNAGLLFQPLEATRIGLAYRSEISHSLDGDLTLGGTSVDASASVELPESATLSFSQGFGDENRLTLLADAAYTRWSRVDTITIETATPGVGDSLALDFKNSWRGSIGAAWEQTEQLTLRGGYTFEESAVQNAETRTPRVPDNHRNWVSLGAGYEFANGLELDASYSHLFIKDTKINNTQVINAPGAGPVGQSTLNGEFESSADILSVQATYRY